MGYYNKRRKAKQHKRVPEKRRVTGDRSPLPKTRKTVEHELKFYTYYIPEEVRDIIFHSVGKNHLQYPTPEEETINYGNHHSGNRASAR